MGRGKVQLKLIEEKSSRHITFCKRKGGLLKKAKVLSVLCDVDVGIIIFSGSGKLFEFSNQESFANFLSHYKVQKDEENRKDTAKKESEGDKVAALFQLASSCMDEKNMEHLNLQQLAQLEKHMDTTLRQARTLKRRMLGETIGALQQLRKQLDEEKQRLTEEVVASTVACGADETAKFDLNIPVTDDDQRNLISFL